MKPAPFDYFAPDTVEEVVGILGEMGDDAKVLSGGQSLVPMLNLRLTRFPALVDVGRVAALREVHFDGSGATIGATVRQCEIEASKEVSDLIPLMARATPLIGHFQIRSRGTVGGSVAHADPAAEYPAVSLALDAEIELTGPAGRRLLPAADFFTGTWTTAAAPEEVLTAVRFPSWGRGAGFAVEEVARRHGDFALAGACVGVRLAGGRIDRAAVSFFGLGSTPVRAAQAEAALVGSAPGDVDSEEIGRIAVADLDPPGDVHASPELRRRIGATVAGRALRSALEEAVTHE
jgi:carbon-monoxide dehydrogenase medium subunit